RGAGGDHEKSARWRFIYVRAVEVVGEVLEGVECGDDDGDTKDREQNGEYGGRDRPAGEKVADVVVVDASVLVHALDQLKTWCGKGREEVVVVPLENASLNTLDTLKKGASSGQIVRRGRDASRYLEGQVDMNPRIRIQSDNEFAPWDSISFSKDGQDTSNDAARSLSECPDWLRRIVCCARWEYDHFQAGATHKGEYELVDLLRAIDGFIC
ncbi:hypothetical protein M0805_001142, partial [Coniferiporia weirii]